MEGDVPLAEAFVGSLDDLDALRAAFDRGEPVVVLVTSAEQVKAALARPEVACAVVPEERRDLLGLDLTELTYG